MPTPPPGGPPALDAVVDRLRQSVLDGLRRPGDRLDETRLGRELGVSRNTLREAFRVLAHEHLLEHRPHRGVFVRRLGAREARDVYATRRLLECGALREAAVRAAEVAADPVRAQRLHAEWVPVLADVGGAVAAGEEARATGEWEAVGTANGRFHLALARLAGNDVVDRTLRGLLTEMRLLFVDVAGARAVHEPYLEDNARIAALVAAGELVRAAVVLEEYLLRAERHLVGLHASDS
ncbi:GntR family transcriptional regulator [Lapillicoccus jejuensis]|uniref:GntR family transcriptional regulator n=1 Tax=Lapillicoccus jejuensis TaxID=402171 RepID=UPI001476B5B3|nr:GntR family transcriptional regulator [Lapillicoccus jejuensis]